MDTFIIKDSEIGTYFIMEAGGKNMGISNFFPDRAAAEAAIERLRRCGDAAVSDQTGQSGNHHVTPRFELFADKTDQFRFRYRDEEGETVITSVVFDSHQDAYQTLRDLKAAAATIPAVDA